MGIEQANYQEEATSPKKRAPNVPYTPLQPRTENEDTDEADQNIDRLLYNINIPPSFKGLTVGGGEAKINNMVTLSHELQELNNEFTYTVRGVVGSNGTRDPDKVTNTFVYNINQFLQYNKVTSIIAVTPGAGIGTPVNGVKEKGSYVSKLIIKFKINEPGKPGIKSLNGIGDYYIQDGATTTADPKKQEVAARAKFQGYQVPAYDYQEAGNQKALYKFGYTYETAGNTGGKPEKSPTTPGSLLTLETAQGKVEIGKQVPGMGGEAAKYFPLLIGGNQVGSIVKCEAEPKRESKAMFLSAGREEALGTPPADRCFTKDAYGNYFPNPANIQKYMNSMPPAGKTRKIMMVTTGPCFESGNTMSGINYDNGKKVGSETLVSERITNGRGIANITKGRLSIEHASELTDAKVQQYVQEGRDIATMSSLLRVKYSPAGKRTFDPNNDMSRNASLWGHPHAHSLVQFSDGTRGEVILNGATEDQRKAIIAGLADTKESSPYFQIDRALYADSDANNNYLDGIFINRNGALTYSQPDNPQNDLFRNPKAQSPALVKNNMPGVMVYYAEQ